MLSPGPANLVSLMLASRHGSRRIIPFQLGILLVYGVVAFGMAAMLNQLANAERHALVWLQLLGGGFIVFLGVRQFRVKGEWDETITVPRFGSGVLLQVFNPKFPPVVMTILATGTSENPFLKAGVVVATGFLGLWIYAWIGSFVHRIATGHQQTRALGMILGCGLCAVGIWIMSAALITLVGRWLAS